MYNIRQKHFPSHIYQYNNDYFDNKKFVLYFTYMFPQFTINIFSYEPFNGVIRKKNIIFSETQKLYRAC